MKEQSKYDVMEVSRHVVNFYNEKSIPIDNLKLQKLLYFIQAYFLVNSRGEEACFKEEIYAWAYGPVVPVAYGSFKEYGSSTIPKIEQVLVFNFSPETGGYFLKYEAYLDNVISDEDKISIDSVLLKFKDISSLALVDITHMQDPWKNVYNPLQRDIIITKQSIYEYFSQGK